MPTAEENTVERNFRPRIGKQVSVLYRDGTLQAGAFFVTFWKQNRAKMEKNGGPGPKLPTQ